MTQLERPHAVRRLVAVVGALGAGCVFAALVVASSEPSPALWRWAVVLALPAIGEVTKLGIRRGASRHAYNWRETAFVLGLVLVPPAQLALAMTAALTVVFLAYRAPATKLVFNAAVVAVGSVVGGIAVVSAHVYSPGLRWSHVFTARSIVLIAFATLCMHVLSTGMTSFAVATERRRPVWLSMRDDLRVAVLIWLRNVGAAFIIIAALAWSASLTVVIIVALLGVQVLSADRAAIREERFAWHRLQVAIDELRDVELDQLIREATTAVATMMRADAAEIQLDDVTGHGTVVRASDIEHAHSPGSTEYRHGHSMDIELTTREGRVGELRLLFSAPVTFNATETDCLNAFANALAVALANAFKFDSIREDAKQRIQAAYSDPVTGVGNLMMLEEHARDALAELHPSSLVAVAVIGLSRFAEVNDLLGAHAADEMLRAVADRLTTVVRRCDVVARLHGAEYVLLLRELPSAAAGVSQAELAVRSLGTAITADGLDLTVDAHTGVACAPTDGDNLDDLIRRARLAMYQARADDVPVYRYQPELEPPALAQLELLRDLRDALESKQLVLHYQPKFSMRGGMPVAAEALVRWNHPQRGLIPPAEFIPLLERVGLVGDLMRYVLEVAIEECAAWNTMGLPLSIAVNLSARNLLDEDLPRFVFECLARNGLPPERLICEITETAVFSRSPIAASILDQLRGAGISLSLDDFCTGYSSLSLLRERAIDEIKIDRSFVADLGVGGRTTHIVTALIELAHRCDIVVTAEGIETAEQQQLLTTLGCDHGQGFLLARPMTAASVRAFFLEAMRPGRSVSTRPVRRSSVTPVKALRSNRTPPDWDDPLSWREAASE
jgi:diguanylate cyclase (GGDEF)-like protein